VEVSTEQCTPPNGSLEGCTEEDFASGAREIPVFYAEVTSMELIIISTKILILD
jgi:hypothetical protein